MSVISIKVSPSEVRYCRSKVEEIFETRQAAGGNAYGTSRFRNAETRNETALEDGLIGQIGCFVLNSYWYGSAERYMLSRYLASQNPLKGDGGSDIPGANIDVKTTRKRDKPLEDHLLLVHPKEFHSDWVYVLIILEQVSDLGTIAHVMGWVTSEQLNKPERDVLRGNYYCLASDLNPMLPVRWLWR
jgi:hypothetical protein